MSVPELRFPEFEGDWKSAKAGDSFTNSRARGEAGLPIYSVTLRDGLVPRDSLERQMGANAADETNLRAQGGDIVYNMMRMWQGAAGLAPKECMVSPAYVVLSPKAETSSLFFDYWFKKSRSIYELWAYSHGLTSDRLRLYFNDFAQIPVTSPSLPEQKKIAAFLGVVDDKLSALQAKRDLLGEYKRGLMQALFSQQIRFTNDNGQAFPDWEEKRLGDVFEVTRGRVLAMSETTSMKTPSQPYPVYSSQTKNNGLAGYFDEFLYKDAITWTTDGANAGDTKFRQGKFFCTNVCGVLLSSSGYANTCVAEMINAVSKKYVSYVGNPKLMNGVMAKIKINLPHPNEQRKIADALTAMDAKIDAVSAQVDGLQHFKKGLLQQMFV